MGENKRYYWMRMQENFFSSKRIKKLRKMAGGDTYTIIYLKMQLLSIENNGILVYSQVEDTFADEIALDIDESADDVLVTINFLMKYGLMYTTDNVEFVFPYAQANIGSETASAQRVRDFRQREKEKLLHCNTDVTQVKRVGNVEKEKEKEIDIEREYSAFPPETKCIQDVSKKPTRHKYGQYKNVLLSDDDIEKLKNEIPAYEEYIEKVSSYVESSGKTYKNYLATIRNWYKADMKKVADKRPKMDSRDINYDDLESALIRSNQNV